MYAPNSYAPDLQADPAFRDAFSAAQNQTLLVVSVNSGTGATGSETATASTGNNQGYFYVRVQGHDDQAFDTATPFHLGLGISGIQDCVGLSTFGDLSVPGPTGPATTVIVTDTQKIGLGAASATAEREAYLDSLDALASDPSVDGVVVDVSEIRPCRRAAAAGGREATLPVRREPGGRRHQGHRGLVPAIEPDPASTSCWPAATR